MSRRDIKDQVVITLKQKTDILHAWEHRINRWRLGLTTSPSTSDFSHDIQDITGMQVTQAMDDHLDELLNEHALPAAIDHFADALKKGEIK